MLAPPKPAPPAAEVEAAPEAEGAEMGAAAFAVATPSAGVAAPPPLPPPPKLWVELAGAAPKAGWEEPKAGWEDKLPAPKANGAGAEPPPLAGAAPFQRAAAAESGCPKLKAAEEAPKALPPKALVEAADWLGVGSAGAGAAAPKAGNEPAPKEKDTAGAGAAALPGAAAATENSAAPPLSGAEAADSGAAAADCGAATKVRAAAAGAGGEKAGWDGAVWVVVWVIVV